MKFVKTTSAESSMVPRSPHFSDSTSQRIAGRQGLHGFSDVQVHFDQEQDTSECSSTGSGVYMAIWEPGADGSPQVKIIPVADSAVS